MGSSWCETNNGKQVEVAPLSKLFDRECPYYLLYGMTYDEYWNDDCFKAKFYRDKYKLKIEEWDRNMWTQGMYIYEALCDVSPILHAFSKKGTNPLPYRDKPLLKEHADKKRQTQEEKEQQQKNDELVARLFFTNWFNATKKQFENKKDKR